MELTFDQAELFPTIAAKAKPKSWLREYIDATKEHGALALQSQIATALGVSHERVRQLVRENKLASVEVGDRTYIPCASFELFLTEERKVGRPFKQPTYRQMIKTTVGGIRRGG